MFERDLFDAGTDKPEISKGFSEIDTMLSQVKVSALPKELCDFVHHAVSSYNTAYDEARAVEDVVTGYKAKYQPDAEEKNDIGWWKYSNPAQWVDFEIKVSNFLEGVFDVINSYIKKNYSVSAPELRDLYSEEVLGEKYSRKGLTFPLDASTIISVIEGCVLQGRSFSDIAEKELEGRVKKIFSIDKSDFYRMKSRDNWFHLSKNVIGVESAVHYNVSYGGRVYSTNVSDFFDILVAACSKIKTGNYTYDFDMVFSNPTTKDASYDAITIKDLIFNKNHDLRENDILRAYDMSSTGIIKTCQRLKRGMTKLTFVNEEAAKNFWTTICDFPLPTDTEVNK